MPQQKNGVFRTIPFLFPFQHHLTFIFCIVLLEMLVALPLRGQATATAGWPISVRFSGKMFLVPTGEKGRHNDLLPLATGPENIVYLQVDKFRTASKTRSELLVFSDMQKHKPAVRVINGKALDPILSEKAFRGKKVAINGFFYQSAGLLWVVQAYVEDE